MGNLLSKRLKVKDQEVGQPECSLRDAWSLLVSHLDLYDVRSSLVTSLKDDCAVSLLASSLSTRLMPSSKRWKK